MTATTTAFDLGTAWDLSPSVSVRPEPFGALLYDFTTRRLSFLKSRQLLDVVRALDAAPDAGTACAAAGVDAAQQPAVTRALAALATAGTITPRSSRSAETEDPR